MKYGEIPKDLGVFEVDCQEMMFYQYLPIKFPKMAVPVYEDRLKVFDSLVGRICCDFIGEYGLNAYADCYIYLTAKHLFQKPNCPLNRPGWHSDGFMTDDVNYIWSDKNPTVFNASKFELTLDDRVSMQEMEEQAKPEMNFTFKEGSLLRLNQFNIHRVAEASETSLRTFVKVSFSGDKYDLMGNSHNYLLDYNWEMKPRSVVRNIPQSITKNKTSKTNNLILEPTVKLRNVSYLSIDNIFVY